MACRVEGPFHAACMLQNQGVVLKSTWRLAWEHGAAHGRRGHTRRRALHACSSLHGARLTFPVEFMHSLGGAFFRQLAGLHAEKPTTHYMDGEWAADVRVLRSYYIGKFPGPGEA